MEYTVYILYSTSLDKFYIGFTSELIEERLRKHLSNHSGFTGKAKDWSVGYQEKFIQKKMISHAKKKLKAGKAERKFWN